MNRLRGIVVVIVLLAGLLWPRAASIGAPNEFSINLDHYYVSADVSGAYWTAQGKLGDCDWYRYRGWLAADIAGRKFSRGGVVAGFCGDGNVVATIRSYGVSNGWVHYVGAASSGFSFRAGATIQRPRAHARKWFKQRMRLGSLIHARPIRGLVVDKFEAPVARFELRLIQRPVRRGLRDTPVGTYADTVEVEFAQRLDIWDDVSSATTEISGTQWFARGEGVVEDYTRSQTLVDGVLTADTGFVSSWWVRADN